ncbi:MAG: hypothetical protein JWP06_577 [Candidatus Saccharibacteria bacterium]|nr:hypothetical protein [Candidatus Saccharibacteria bacterium]
MKAFTYIKHKAGIAVLAFAFAIVSTLSPWLGMAGTAFAAAPTMPVNLRLLTGGNSVAVLWEPAAGGDPATSYKIYRGGVLKATVSPVTNNETAGNTQRWLDTTVVNGTAYSYAVSAVNVDGESAQTASKSITHSSTPAVPTITIDPSTPASLTTFANSVKTLLQAWYPKIVWYLGNPTGTSTSITLTPISGLGNTAQQVGNTIQYNQEWAVANASSLTAPNLFLHEATHVAQLSGMSSVYLPWAHEGMADYMKKYLFGDSNLQTISMSSTDETWMRGYEYSAYLFNYITKNYNKPNFVKDLDATFAPTYDAAFFKNQTGLIVGELWQKLGGRKVSSPTYFRNVTAGFKCMAADGPVYGAPDGTNVILNNCDFQAQQQWEWIPDSPTSNQGELRLLTLPVTGKCADVYGSGTTDGTRVYIWGCNTTAAQKWILQSNGALKNPNSGKCLQPVAGGTTVGTGMEISTCTSTDIQNWFQRPIGMFKIQAGAGCISSSVAPTQIFGCSDGTASQQWSYNQTTPGATSGTIKTSAGNCLQPLSGSLAANATMETVACTGATTQNWQWQTDSTVKNIGSGLCLTLPAWASPWQMTQTTCTSPTSLKKFDVLYQY